MGRVSMSDKCHTCNHTYSTHETKSHLVVCSCRQFVAAPDVEDKTLSTLENIEEQLKRLNAAMERFEPFLAANRPIANDSTITIDRLKVWVCEDCGGQFYPAQYGSTHDCPAKNAPTTSQEAQQPREDLKPVVREGDEEFSALAASLYEALEGTHNSSVVAHTTCSCFREPGKCKAFDAIRVSRQLIEGMRPRYEDYKAQQCDHDQADREDAER